MNAGNASETSLKSIFFTELSINTPTNTSAPLVAALGINMKIGESSNDTRKSIPTKKEVSPLRPPSAIPDALSIYVVRVDEPSIAPHVVPIASLIIASFT